MLRALALTSAVSLAACGAFGPEPRALAPEAVALPGPPGQPPPAPPPAAAPATPDAKPLAGTEDLKLEGRERRTFDDVVSQLYAPCPSEAVSIKQCVDEHRACPACAPAARLLGEKIHEGATVDEARRIYGLRFGPNVKTVDVTGSPAHGPANAPVTIVVFSDFECPHCKHAMPVLDQVLEKRAPNVRLVHKFYPLRQHTHAEAAARAAIAALNQGKYWEMEKVLFDHQDEQSDTDLAGYAADLKLDMRRYGADLSASNTTKMLERDHEEAERAGISGTPFILINGREFDTSLFHIGTDLDAWVALEIKLLGR